MLYREGPSGDDIIFALSHRDRIARIDLLGLTIRQLKTCAALMQGPFQSLRTLRLSCLAEARGVPVITDTFLGGSAPRLQEIDLCHIPFPTLPNILFSANGLVILCLEDITKAGYIPPDVMASCLAMLTRLNSFKIRFRSRRSFPNRITRHTPPLTRTVLPVLAIFVFEGVSEYSEELMAQIDASSLDYLHLDFFYQSVFDIPQVFRFIHCTEAFKPPARAMVQFFCDAVDVVILPSHGHGAYCLRQLHCTGIDKQLSSLEQVLTQCPSIFSHTVRLRLNWRGDSEINQPMSWLGCLRRFKGVQILHVTDGNEELTVHIARMLGELGGEGASEVLPTLHTLILRRFHTIHEVLISLLKPFLDARQRSGHPVKVE